MNEPRELTDDEILEELGREEIVEFVRRGALFERGGITEFAYLHAKNKREARVWMQNSMRNSYPYSGK